jgi:hypothetical protein
VHCSEDGGSKCTGATFKDLNVSLWWYWDVNSKLCDFTNSLVDRDVSGVQSIFG